MFAFMSDALIGNGYGFTRSRNRTLLNPREKSISLSRTRMMGSQARVASPSSGNTQSLVGCRVASVTNTLLLSICINTSAVYRLSPLAVSTFFVKKSQDQSVAACRFKNRSQTGSARSGAGSIPCSFRIDPTVVRKTDMIPSLRSSPRIHVYPQP